MNEFWSDSKIMVPEWNHFIFMQIDNPRWPPGAVTKNSIITKMTISQEPLVEIDATLCQNVSCMKPIDVLNGTVSNLCKLTTQDGRQEPIVK